MRSLGIIGVFVSLLSGHIALAAPPSGDGDSGRTPASSATDVPEPPSVGVTLLAGIAFPGCDGQPEACSNSLGPAASLRGLVLYQPTRGIGFGVMGQVARVHWHNTFQSYGGTGEFVRADSDLTAGFVGGAVRFTLFPEYLISPVIELGLGTAFQAQTGSNTECNEGAIPAGQLGLGATAYVASSFSVFAMGTATGGLKGDCSVSDGAPATPFAGWGYGLHVGAAFDIGLGGATRVAATDAGH